MGSVVVACAVTFLICVVALRRHSLTLDGAFAAFPVGVVSVLSGPRSLAVLLAFFVSCSVATHIGRTTKRRLLPDYDSQSRRGRTWAQVLASGGVGTAVAAFRLAVVGFESSDSAPLDFAASPLHSILLASFVSAYAFGTADTYASEIGVLSRGSPRMITTWRLTPKGTNGGVSLLGMAASAAGGLVIGAAACFAGSRPYQPSLLVLGLVAGLLGSVVDSFVGATCQYTGVDPKTGLVAKASRPKPGLVSIGGWPILTNAQVNFVCSLAMAIVCPAMFHFIATRK